jgi:hypothetical protein
MVGTCPSAAPRRCRRGKEPSPEGVSAQTPGGTVAPKEGGKVIWQTCGFTIPRATCDVSLEAVSAERGHARSEAASNESKRNSTLPLAHLER